MTERSGRTVSYGYDSIYRLTSETIAADPNNVNGAASYVYDNVGNRTQKTSTIPGFPGGLTNYNANDQISTDSYDNNGNTTASNGLAYVYDFENHVIQAGSGITMVYDGDGNRVSKTVGGVTTKYLVDTQNPTGYAQVASESITGNTTQPYDTARVYVYGLERISQQRSYVANNQGQTQTSYYIYDGHGSTRALTDPNGAVTDTYDYDAFGNLLHSTGATFNEFLFSGEQFDSDLGLYYNRARYLNVSTGRFWTVDSFEGAVGEPSSLHKYLYASSDPIDRIDPSGHEDLNSVMTAAAISVGLSTMTNILITGIFTGAAMPPGTTVDAITISAHGTLSSVGITAEGGIDLLYQIATHKWFFALTGGVGTNPLGAFGVGRGLGGSVNFGVVMNMVSPNDMAGFSVSAVWPLSVLSLFQSALFNSNKSWGLLTQLAKNVNNVSLRRHASVGFGISSSGSPFASLALRTNAFGSFFYDSTNFYPASASGLESFWEDVRQTFGRLISVAESITGAASFAQNGDAILQAVDASE